MSLNFTTDTSTQLTYSSFGFTTPQLDNFATSNYIQITSNNLQININTKQNLLTAATNLLGVGSAITALDYTKITLNKPTDFQANWNTTVINKPSTFPADMTNIYTKGEVNSAITTSQTISSNYTIITSNILQSNINTKLTIPTASTTLIGIGSNLTLLDYNNIKKTPILDFLPNTGGTLTGNLITQQLYINNPNSTSSIFFNPTASIYSLFSRKPPWAMYFAEDYNTTTKILPNYISNGRDAIGSGTGTITKTTLAGNGATGAITYISGGTDTTINFPTGSIPSNFTILSLSRYTNASTQGRILTSSAGNWLLGYNYTNDTNFGAFFEGWKTGSTRVLTNITDWLCMIGKNSGATPNNIIANGTAIGTATGGAGGGTYKLAINNDIYNPSTKSNWALSCVMIWDTILTDTEMFDLNTIINDYKISGTSIKTLLDSINDDECVIESRIYGGTEKTELLLFKGNDPTGTNGADRIRLRAGNIAFDTYSSTTTNRNLENIVMFINENGNVGIGTTTILSNKLNVNGSISATNLIGIGSSISQLDYNKITLNKPSTFPADMTNIYNKTETNNLLDAKQPTLTAGTTLLGIGGSITAIDYNKITLNPLTFTSPLSKSAENAVLINLSSYSTTGNDSSYVLKSGSTMTGNLTINAELILKNSVWHRSIDGVYRFYYGLNDVSYYCCGGNLADGHIFMDSVYNHRFKIKNNGNIEVSGTITEGGTLLTSKYLQLVGGTITGNLNITGSLLGAVNVSRRAQFTFTPTQILIGGLGLRYIHTINLNNYITGINSSVSGINRVFRITIWGESGDFGDDTANVETMQFLIFMSFFGGINGGKRRIYQIINESNGSTISYSNAETVYYNGWNGTGGSAQKFCIIENIAGY